MFTQMLLMVALLGCCQGYSYSHNDHRYLQYHGPTAIPHVLKDGHLADTHEVAAAKAEHLTAVAKARSYGGYGYGDHGYAGGHEYEHGHEYSYDNHGHLLYHGPTAIPHVLKNGHIADTHEVAAAKAEHFAAVAKARTYGEYGYGGHGYAGGHEYEHGHEYSYDNNGHFLYHGPTAIPHVLKNGHIADTHEVAAAKAEHLTAVAKARTYGGYGYGGHGYAGGHEYEHGHEYSYDNHGHFLYHGPTAIPHVLKNGHIADTHEVAAAKAEHFAAVAKAKAHYYGGYDEGYTAGYAGGYSGGYTGKYHGPVAKPVVLKSGYLADTHEVAAAKERHIHALHKAGSYGQHGYY